MPPLAPPPNAGQPVPAVPTCKILNIASFKPGNHNGEKFTAADIRELYANWKKYCSGPNKEFTPWLNLNHNDSIQFGEWADCRLDENAKDGPVLQIDAVGVPVEIGQAVNSGAMRQPSIEFYQPGRDAAGNAIGYQDKQGRIVQGLVPKCLSLLGNKLPGVRGLPPLPVATFQSRNVATRRFASNIMDRAAMIQALQAAGVDVSTVTDAVPDALLQSMLDCIQKGAAGGNNAPVVQQADNTGLPMGGNNGNATIPPTQMANNNGVISNPVQTPDTNNMPTSVTLKFQDQVNGLTRMIGGLQSTVATLQQQTAATVAQNAIRFNEAKKECIRKFFDEMSDSGQIPVGARPAYEKLFDNVDHVQVRKFAAGTVQGTALEERMSELRASLPKVKVFGPKIGQGSVTAPANGSVRPDVVRAAILGSNGGDKANQKALKAYEAKVKA